MKEAVLEGLRGQFRPEILNRVDETIVFHTLSTQHLMEVVEIQLGHLRARLQNHGIVMEITERAREFLVEVGYDPHYGARPLKRSIQKELENPLGRLLLEGRAMDGDSIVVDYEAGKGELTFTASEAEVELIEV